MKEKLEFLFNILNQVIPNKVFYGVNLIDNNSSNSTPFIVYQEISKRGLVFADDKNQVREVIIQITLVTDNKNIEFEESLEESLTNNNLEFQMLTEYLNSDHSVNRIYEVRMEVIKHE